MAIKDSQGGASFLEWDAPLKLREPEAIRRCRHELSDEICFWQFLQSLFAKQWQALKAYANGKGISIIGDIPIYVALDSADTWSHPELFQLSEGCVPKAVAGVPPDAFSATGQLWGNPLYDWEYHRKTEYEWWTKRLKFSSEIYDIVRIDHFRGFESYYAIPYGNETAEKGEWRKGPGVELFKTVQEKLGNLSIIAEDLGFITDDVRRMLNELGYPGMKVMQFAFGEDSKNEHLPHNFETSNCIAYTGTHDNETLKGWVGSSASGALKYAMTYFNIKKKKDIPKGMIKAAWSSVARIAVAQIQDFLESDPTSRMNTPSTLGGNWQFRTKEEDFSEKLSKKILKLNKIYNR